jgi:uncharacterized membrane protein
MEAHIGLMVITVFLGGFYLLLPRISRRGLLFGVYVGEQAWQNDSARRITKSWYVDMSVWLAVSLAVELVLGLLGVARAPGIIAILLLTVGFFFEYVRAYRKALALASPGTPPAAAVLAVGIESRSVFLPYLAMALGLFGGLFALWYAGSHFDQLPERVPTHFGISGRPDVWRPRSFGRTMMLPLMDLVIGFGLGLASWLIAQAKRAVRYNDRGVSFEAQQRFRGIMANFLAIVSILVTGMLTVLGYSAIRVSLGEAEALSPAFMVLPLLLGAFALGGSVYIALKYGQGGSRLERSVDEAPLTNGLADNRKWILGLLYVNPEDPSIFVERRFGLGYTPNLGNPKVAAFLGALVVVLALLVLLSAVT